MEVTSDLDVEVLLSDIIGDAKTVNRHVQIFEEKNHANCLIKPKGVIPKTIWLLINNKVKEWRGRWSRKERVWTVPLHKKQLRHSPS